MCSEDRKRNENVMRWDELKMCHYRVDAAFVSSERLVALPSLKCNESNETGSMLLTDRYKTRSRFAN